MSIRKIAMLAALCALAAMSFASSAMAATFLHENSPTGAVYTGSQLNGSLLPGTTAVLTSSLGNITCTASAFQGTVGASGGATISGTLSSLTFTSCTDSIPFITISSCSRTASSTITATATGAGTGTLTIPTNGITVACNFGSTTCTFVNSGGPITGSVSNQGTASRLTFSNAQVTSTGGLCPSTAAFTAQYQPVTGVTGGTSVPLFLNTV